MRWLTGFAILVYLALLSSPQTLAVYGSGVSRLADTQLQGLNPAISSALHQQELVADNDVDDKQPAIQSTITTTFQRVKSATAVSCQWFAITALTQAYSARAPPVSTSL
ncbi:hypothetical protein [Arsukibacterium indicum]|uniref:Uncharacterized protein n=1 Tax=Arsukibacterium indicum TaxID=2848612 RepID=A0ABS6MFQ5_9GAMM|nr:hypothetical protein [Arsukibacterium indicum]MBV2127640.1 hypothetical protein [Arsukibacterium indicum]